MQTLLVQPIDRAPDCGPGPATTRRRPGRRSRVNENRSPRTATVPKDSGCDRAPVSTSPRLAGLDLLRLLAVVLVLMHHLPWEPPTSWPGPLRWALLAWNRGGWVGVDLFFVLSGFLISGLLFTEFKARGRVSILRFYVRRGWKIYPPFFALIAFTVIIHWLCFGQRVARDGILSELFFLQSYVKGVWVHTWSLAVEEHFYLLLPMVLAVLARCNRNSATPFRPILALTAVVAAVVLGLRVVNWYWNPGFGHLSHRAASHLSLDSLFFGVAIAYAYHFHSKRFIALFAPWRKTLIVAGGLCLMPAFLFPIQSTPWVFTVGYSLFYLGSGMLLVGVLLSNLPRNRLVLILAFLGACSYSIYLWHPPLVYVMKAALPELERLSGYSPGFGVRLLLYLMGSLALGVVMNRFVEVPILQVRDHWFPRRTVGPIELHAPQSGNRSGHGVTGPQFSRSGLLAPPVAPGNEVVGPYA